MHKLIRVYTPIDCGSPILEAIQTGDLRAVKRLVLDRKVMVNSKVVGCCAFPLSCYFCIFFSGDTLMHVSR